MQIVARKMLFPQMQTFENCAKYGCQCVCCLSGLNVGVLPHHGQVDLMLLQVTLEFPSYRVSSLKHFRMLGWWKSETESFPVYLVCCLAAVLS